MFVLTMKKLGSCNMLIECQYQMSGELEKLNVESYLVFESNY